MAYTKKNVVKETPVKDTVVNEEIKTVEEKKVVEKKKFEPDDMIECLSITPGELFFIGNRTNDLYTFADMNDTVFIPFKDLDYAARSKDALMYKPRFIVQDKDFVALHPQLDTVYSALHSTKDLKAILNLPANQMKETILSLPIGAQEALKTIAATMVDNGTLDSIKRVKVIDDIFDTNMFLKLTND